MQDSIHKIRTNPELIQRENWLSGHKWYTVATEHRKTDKSELTMGVYQNYCHDEYTFFVNGDNIRISKNTIHNNNAAESSYSKLYNENEFNPKLIPLFNQLIEMSKK